MRNTAAGEDIGRAVGVITDLTHPFKMGLKPASSGVHLRTPSEYKELQHSARQSELDTHCSQSPSKAIAEKNDPATTAIRTTAL